MRKKISKKFLVAGACLLVAIGILAGTASISQTTHAEGGGQAWAGPGGTGSGGNSNCENKSYSKATGNRCGGVSWVKRAVDTAHAQCLAIGATEYYKLGWNMYTGPGSAPRYTGDIGRTALKTSYARNLPYRPVASGSVSWAQAESDYQIAKQYLPSGSPSWDNTGEFCWNPEWGCSEEDCPPPDVPDPDEDTIYGEGDFWADSHIDVTNEVATHSADVSSKAGSTNTDVTIKVSTDSSATVTFKHKMSFDDELYKPSAYSSKVSSDHPTSDTNDEFEEIKTKLKIQQYGDSGNNSVKDEDFGTGGKSGSNKDKEVASTTVSVSPSPGENLSVCQVLTHQSVHYIIKGEDQDSEGSGEGEGSGSGSESGDGEDEETHEKWEFSKYAEDNNVGYTILCAEVYRPEDPSGGDPDIWAKNKGSNDTTPMFAGETANIGWDVNAEWEEARRVRGWQAIAFTVPSNVDYSRDKVTGDLSGRGTADPCSFYRKAGWGPSDTWCSVIGGRSTSGGSGLGESGSHEYDESQTIALQDYVGYKYCTSFGYYWEYWYSISYGGNDNWQYEGKNYWTNFNAACRTIAKKPSSAYWNSGVLTNGGIKTSLSPRLLGVGAAQTAGLNNFDVLYGSWAEHLAAVGGTTSSFASGAALSRGSNKNVGAYNDIYPRSPMTISNTTSSLGHSGIGTSNTLRTRLETYLQNSQNQDLTRLSSLDGLPANITSGNYIVNLPGGSTINRDIRVAGGPYSSIYQIPQVVIFVNGDVKIAGGVTEIDAWIIASGKIDTCSDFQSGSTQTKSLQRNEGTACDRQLVINGPVISSQTLLYRSFGSDPVAYGASSARYTPGEIFNLSGENYLWAYAQAGRYSSSYTEAYSRELAPRY